MANGCCRELVETHVGQYIFPFPSLYVGKEKAKSLAHKWLLVGGTVATVFLCAHARIRFHSQAKQPKEIHTPIT